MTLKELLQGTLLPHPFHPALVHFPIGFFMGSFLTDLASFFFPEAVSPGFFAQMSYILIVGGVVFAVPAAITGMADWLGIDRSRTTTRKLGIAHMIIVDLALLGYVIQLFLRDFSASWAGGTVFILNLISLSVLATGAMFGGQLVFKHHVGLRSTPEADRAHLTHEDRETHQRI